MSRPIKQDNNVQRIVSLVPSVTSILLALGAGRELVGVSKWCKDVANVGKRPQVGDCWKMDIADVMQLEPTLLIGSVPFATDTVAKILQEPVAFLALNPRSLADIENNIRLLGRVIGRSSGAEGLIVQMGRGFKSMAKQAQRMGHRKPRVYCEVWPNPRISSPPWVAELVKICGGEMCVPAGEKITDEQVAEAKPEVVILAWAATGKKADPNQAYRVAAWKDVPAIRMRKVYVISDELLNTPGPPLVRGARELWDVLHSPSNRGRENGRRK